MTELAAAENKASLEENLLVRAREHVASGITATMSVVAGGAGARLFDPFGREEIDFASGIGVLNLGHQNARVIAAVHDQVDRYLHQCVMVSLYEPYVDVCEELAHSSPWPNAAKSLLVNSGAEAIENAVKVARVATGRRAVIALHRSFHGRTIAALSLTGRVRPYKEGFGPLLGDVYHAPAPYEYWGIRAGDALCRLDDVFLAEVAPDDVACVVVEAVQGEGGVVPLGSEYLRGVAERCSKYGILLVVDEIQCGLRRTGPFWAFEEAAITPDLIVGGKALGGGFPLASVTGRAEILDAVPSGGFGGTFNGHPVSCAAAKVTLQELRQESLRDRIDVIGFRVRERLNALRSRHECIGDVRVCGCMIGIELTKGDPAAPDSERAQAVVAAARRAGVVVLQCGVYGQVVRLLPPLTITDAELEEGFDRLGLAFDQTEGGSDVP